MFISIADFGVLHGKFEHIPEIFWFLSLGKTWGNSRKVSKWSPFNLYCWRKTPETWKRS